jgi:hypothetical protein
MSEVRSWDLNQDQMSSGMPIFQGRVEDRDEGGKAALRGTFWNVLSVPKNHLGKRV